MYSTIRLLLIAVLLPSLNVTAQHYSNRKVWEIINQLETVVSNNDTAAKNFKSIYAVYDETFADTTVYNKNLPANKAAFLFKNLLKKAKINDFQIMATSKNPGIRVYGVWALAKKEKFNLLFSPHKTGYNYKYLIT